MSVQLKQVEPRRLYQHIADQIRELIQQGGFDIGTRLPPERDLAQQLGVSRPSLREALIALDVEGSVEIRSGSGMVEVRIRLTEQGPVHQMQAVRLELKAEEAVSIESKTVEIKATEGSVKVESKEEVDIDAEGAVRVVGKTIHLN